MEYYQQLQAAVEGRALLSADWRSSVSNLLKDARVLYRDRSTRKDATVLDMLSSAIAKSHLQRAKGAMGADKSFYLRYILPPPLDSLAFYAGIVKQAYSPQGRRADTALASIGIEKPVAGAVDDSIEQEFLVFLFAKVQQDADVPAPHARNGKLSRRWRHYVRRTFDEFMCRRVGVRVALTDGCAA